MVRILVMAGANIGTHPNAKEQGPAVSQVLFKGAGEYELEMLQTLLGKGLPQLAQPLCPIALVCTVPKADIVHADTVTQLRPTSQVPLCPAAAIGPE